MSQPLAPRPSQTAGGSPPETSSSQRPRKISTACGACKQRKTRVSLPPTDALPLLFADGSQCTGGTPCDACSTRKSPCVYDASSDQRRKIANQRNVQDLADTQLDLDRHRQLLGGIIATIRVGDDEANIDLVRVIRSGVDLSQLAAHVRNECRANLAIQKAFDDINFLIDGPRELPSPTQLLSQLPAHELLHPSISMGSESSETSANHFTGDPKSNRS